MARSSPWLGTRRARPSSVSDPLLTIEIDPRAIEDGRQAALYYRGESPQLAARFEAEVERVLRRILEAPLQFPGYEDSTRRALLRTFPYGIVYEIEGDVVRVVAFAALRRRPGYWK